jgi:hypothetical protein
MAVAGTAEFTRSTGLPARACAVLALGVGAEGVESVAIWHVSSEGATAGAWVRVRADVLADADHARGLLVLLEGRAITGASPAAVDDWLERLSAVAGLGGRGRRWKGHTFSPVDAFGEIVARRKAYAATVNAERRRNKSVAVLTWPHDLPDNAGVTEFAELRQLAGIACPEGTPVVSEALTVARVLSWLAEVWAETEDVKARRSYVRLKHGAAEPLPPAWLGAVRTAAGTGQSS